MTAFPRTLLGIINQAQQELGLPQSSTIIGNTDPTTVQMLGMAQKTGEEIRDIPEEGWTTMGAEFNLAVTVPTTTTGNTTLNSPIITGIPSTSGLAANAWVVTGSTIPTAARIKSVDSSSQVTMTMVATGAATATPLVFAQDTYALSSDFRGPKNRTWWDRTNRWELLGPDSPQMDQWHRSGIVATGPRRHFRMVGRLQGSNPTYRLWPPPAEITAPIQIAFEYFSTDWILLQGGAPLPPAAQTFSSVWVNDTDVPVLDDRAIIDGIKWRFWKMKGFNYKDDRNDWLDLVDRLIARDGAAPTLQLAKRQHPIFISPANVQDGFFPGPVGSS